MNAKGQWESDICWKNSGILENFDLLTHKNLMKTFFGLVFLLAFYDMVSYVTSIYFFSLQNHENWYYLLQERTGQDLTSHPPTVTVCGTRPTTPWRQACPGPSVMWTLQPLQL